MSRPLQSEDSLAYSTSIPTGIALYNEDERSEFRSSMEGVSRLLLRSPDKYRELSLDPTTPFPRSRSDRYVSLRRTCTISVDLGQYTVAIGYRQEPQLVRVFR